MKAIPNLDSLEKKLRVLGDEVVVVTATSLISKQKDNESIICYRFDGDNLVSERYDNIYYDNKSIEFGVVVATKENDDYILDTQFRVKFKLQHERVEKLIDGKYLILANKTSNEYRIADIQGKLLVGDGFGMVNVYRQGKWLTALGYRANRSIAIIGLNHRLNGNVYNTIVYMGTGGIILQNDENTVKMVSLGLETRLVIRDGRVRVKTAGLNKAVISVNDSFGNVIKTIATAEKLF